MAKISVVITVYNVASYLDECIQSVRNQTFDDLEIIIVDDGSTDGSAEICDRAAEEDNRIRVIHKENGGAMSARKSGALAATSEYLIFVDGDDWIDIDFYEELYCEIKKDPVDVVLGGHKNDGWGLGEGEGIVSASSIHSVGVYRGNQLNNDFYRYLIYGGIRFFQWGISPSLVDKLAVRKKILPFLLRVDERIWDGDDSCCVYPFLLNVDALTITGCNKYHHRYRANSLCHTNDIHYFERLQILQKNLWEGVVGTKNEKVVFPQVKRFVFEMAIKNISVLYHLPVQTVKEGYLFPYNLVPRGSRIVLYGAGIVGQEFYRQLKFNCYAELVSWVDRNKRIIEKYNIDSPESLAFIPYDYIVISVANVETSKEIEKYLENYLAIPKEKIIWADYKYRQYYGVDISYGEKVLV